MAEQNGETIGIMLTFPISEEVKEPHLEEASEECIPILL